MKLRIVHPPPVSDTTAVPMPDDRPAVGSWWWVQGEGNDPSDYDEPGRKYLACVTEVGSNYAEIQGVYLHDRLSLDEFHTKCTAAPEHATYVARKIGFHTETVRQLMGEIQRVCGQIGVPMRQALAEAEVTSTAIATAHSIGDVKAYQKALVTAKDKTLPELFAKVKEQHEQMAKWMKAELIPIKAELDAAKGATEIISDKIHTVELYAGLHEELVQVRKGKAAPEGTKVHLMQRRHYMDEECLARYEAGGMSFEDIGDFDKWLSRDENFRRILPHDRCIIAFRIRHYDRQTDERSIEAFIQLWHENEANRATFLYIRNGKQLWRMETSIDFEDELFPKREDKDLLGDHELWIKVGGLGLRHDGDGLITGRARAAKIDAHTSKREYHAQKMRQWKAAGSPKGEWSYIAIEHEDERYRYKPGETHLEHGRPSGGWDLERNPVEDYELLTPMHIYYDDAMKRVRRAAFEHNRIAVIVQGLLDRSTCLHPHPPWKIWTADGFAAGIELVYDVSEALTSGPKLKWEAYRAQLNKSIKPGCYTIGQARAWKAAMEERYGHKWQDHVAYDDKGPGKIARVEAIKRGKAVFRWTRERSWRNPVWVPADRPGYIKKSYPEIPVTWSCDLDALTCISAYTPGDFHLFYDDPRTRAEYIRWAPILLAAEDWHAKRRQPDVDEAAEGEGND